MIEPRIYRAAFLPALLALVMVAFSLETPPRALDQGSAADVLFEGTSAIETVRSIVAATPDRSPGSAGDQASARRVASAFRTNGFTTTVDRFDDDGHPLVNVIGRRAGDSSRAVVVLAARDSDRVPDATGSAADTAALIEFARVFEGRALGRTLVLASVDGGQLGDAGVRRFAERMAGSLDVEAVIVMSDLGAKRSRGPLIIGWSNGTTRSGLGLQRTVTTSLREEVGSVPKQDGTLTQFARLAFPVAPGGQGVLLDRGFDAVRVSGAGEVAGDSGRLRDMRVLRYGDLGRAVLRMIFTLDQSKREPERGQHSYVTVGGMVLPSWALTLLALTLVLPALVASVDALARARRRHEPVAVWFVWLAAAVLPFVLALLLAWLMVLVGLIDDAPPAPLDPRGVTLDAAAWSALIVTSLTVVLAWLVARRRVLGRSAAGLPDPSAPGAACAVSLVFCAVAFAVTIVNPFAGLVLVPAVHLWMLATLTDMRPRTSVLLGVLGLAPLVAVALVLMWRLELSPVRAAYYLLLLVTGNQTGLLTTVVGCVLLGVTASVAAILVARVRKGGGQPRGRTRLPEEPRPSVFGPGGHAGPGMLGGVGSGSGRR